nr:hypothetical protein [uncultured Draconibacterium sp.]
MLIGIGLTLISLIAIACQDFSSRSVYWWWFIVLFVGAITHTISKHPDGFSWTNILVNVCLVLLVSAAAALYYFVRYKGSAFGKLKNSIGLGDFAMLPTLVLVFSPVNFLLFFIATIVISIIGSVITVALTKKNTNIPLAGYWAVSLLFCVIGSSFSNINLYNDSWIYLWLQI